ncbi:MAG: ABC transporter permease [Anaerolineae bacterium]|nr:ABC transporter permease [Anaerolineae bacterium]
MAAVVALRSLALMIADELTTNLAEINRGDIQIVPTDRIDATYWQFNNQNERVFSPDGMEALQEWATDESVDVQFASTRNFLQLLPLDETGEPGNPFSVVAILVQPGTWPYYGASFSTDGRPLSVLFDDTAPNIVLSRRAARDHRLAVGDQVLVGGLDTPFIVSALVDDEAEGSLLLRNGPAGLLGFVYYPLNQAEDIGLTPLPDAAYVRLDLGRDVSDVDASLEARFGEDVSRITTAELEEQNEETASLVNDLILVMGLSSVLIGGIGIINTMLVIVSRRTLEVAVLKTFGLKAWRVTVLFLVEAALMGAIGSLVGIALGVVLSYLVRGVGEEVLQSSLSWRPYPEAWFSGLTLGVVVTVAFGFLPTLDRWAGASSGGAAPERGQAAQRGSCAYPGCIGVHHPAFRANAQRDRLRAAGVAA